MTEVDPCHIAILYSRFFRRSTPKNGPVQPQTLFPCTLGFLSGEAVPKKETAGDSGPVPLHGQGRRPVKSLAHAWKRPSAFRVRSLEPWKKKRNNSKPICRRPARNEVERARKIGPCRYVPPPSLRQRGTSLDRSRRRDLSGRCQQRSFRRSTEKIASLG